MLLGRRCTLLGFRRSSSAVRGERWCSSFWRTEGDEENGISEETKEEVYEKHRENPELNNAERLASDYRIKKQRVHAILWLKEMQKQEEVRLGSCFGDSLENFYESVYGSEGSSEKKSDVVVVAPDGWEGKVDDQALREHSKKEEQMLSEEFERRVEFNKKQIYGFVKTHIMSRRRPIDGWSYMVEELGLEAKRGRGGVRTVTEPDGTKRNLNEEVGSRERFISRQS